MSAYLYYRFERLNGQLNASEMEELRSISSRAEITRTHFSVEYHYSQLKADPSILMLRYFDIGFHYANWGTMQAFIRLPAGTLPEPFLDLADDNELKILQDNCSQVVTFSEREYQSVYYEYRADEFLGHMVGLRGQILEGDYRLLYLGWMRKISFEERYDSELPRLPLIDFDFERLTPEQDAFVALFEVPHETVRALSLLLQKEPSHQVDRSELSPEEWVSGLSVSEKDALLCKMYESGNLNRSDAINWLSKLGSDNEMHFQFWLSAARLKPYQDIAAKQIEDERALALKARKERERLEKEARMKVVYAERETFWSKADAAACQRGKNGYDSASDLIHELYEAYSYHSQQSEFVIFYRHFTARHERRGALMRRLEKITASVM